MGFLQIPWKLLKMQVIQVSSLHMEKLTVGEFACRAGVYYSGTIHYNTSNTRRGLLYFKGIREVRVTKTKISTLFQKSLCEVVAPRKCSEQHGAPPAARRCSVLVRITG